MDLFFANGNGIYNALISLVNIFYEHYIDIDFRFEIKRLR